jgi:hypothetical protein
MASDTLLALSLWFTKGGTKMTSSNNSTVFCVLLTKICISLFFLALASKNFRLLIAINYLFPENPNRIQREFLFNDAIASQKLFSCLRQCHEKTNLFKRRRAVTSRRRQRGVLSLRAADREACCHFAPPIQRRAVTSRRRPLLLGVCVIKRGDFHLP